MTLTISRIGWISYFQSPDNVQAEKGVIDLRGWTFTDDQTISLDGEWEFYPEEFIEPSMTGKLEVPSGYIHVPQDWKEQIADAEQKTGYGYGTYRITIKLPDSEQQLYGLRFKEIKTAAAVFVNGKQVGEYNTPNEAGTKNASVRGPFYALFHKNKSDIELLVHVSNYEYPFGGGILESVMIGSDTAVIKEANQSFSLQLTVGIIYLLHSLYAFAIYFSGKRKGQRQLLIYGIFLVISAFSILLDDDAVIQLPIGVQAANHLLMFLFMSILLAMLYVVKHLFNIKSRFLTYITGLYAVLAIALTVIPYAHSLYLSVPLSLFYISSLYFLFSQTIKTIRKGYSEAIFILFWIACYSSNVIWGSIIKAGGLHIPYYPFDFIVSVVVIAFLLLKQHDRVVKVNEEQTLKLQSADQQKDGFLANTAHELRNPLHGIITIAQTLMNNKSQSEKDKNSLELLVSVGQRMTLLLNDLLDVTRLREGFIRLDQKSVRIQGIVPGIFDLNRYVLDGKPVQLHLEVEDDFPPVYADENRLIQILSNLIQNAIKYTNEGHIVVSATQEKGMAAIHVLDTGIGMSEAMQEKVFEPYEQEHSRATSQGGIGLGLAVCRELAELHGGKITVASSVGEGTVFTVTLPLSPEPELEATHQPKTALPAANPNKSSIFTAESSSLPINSASVNEKAAILIVDDDPVNVRVMSMLLDSDYEVTTATSGEDALAYVKRKEFDLVISDVMMPRMSGYELTRYIRQLYTMSELPILLLTARSELQDIYTGFDAGANDYVAKPVDSMELKMRVEGLIELKQSIHQQLRMEAAWLQAQIQPHFLFNTLNTIASLAEFDTKRMLRLLEEFANYLRRSFSNVNIDSLIPLEEELDLTRSYVYIEQERFGERLRIEWETDNKPAIQIPPLSIQPLVENAIRHGVLKKVEGGTVTIRITNHTDYTEVSIIDDGVGMNSAKVQELTSGESIQDGNGIGIVNTDRRCKQLFGKGLFILSEEGKGTEISFQIPLQEKKSD
ncbi:MULTISPECIES: ATP-binding protein [unclassified Sporosarcina]|uniref:hybrid sensor histidine kinase/response regulator n=1 Tax=unclassified Sporosarcina TaxID=2647733 RepID=UPI002040BE66|nr:MULTISPECIES: ATP-binding protein [unclassified Sporosarcina]GKV64323.1 hypothetical protein NCCP2331_04760 [Sporosarcina sp. NCCP-2331]GLB55068.1 hypothetical protein NCCP2378_08540 [Sporosarcina sp. NCCP-2378]